MMPQETVLRRPLRALRYLLVGIALCAAVGGGCFFLGRAAAAPKAPELSAVVLENRLSGVSELSSVTYTYTNMAQFESSSDFYGVTLPFTTKRFLLTYDGVIKAGVDLSRAEVTLSGTAVRVRLPASQILSHTIDEGSVEVFDEKNSIFNPLTVTDFTGFQADQKAAMEEKALSRGLLAQAQTQAEQSVRALLTPALPEGYTLRVDS